MSVDPEVLRQLQKAREPKPKKEKKPIAKVSKKKQGQKILDKVLADLDKEFYLTVWTASPHKCQNCGCGLGNTANNIFFHHLLPKSKYPQFRHTPENIMLLCLEDHSKAETNMDFVPEVRRRTEEAEKILLKPFYESK